MVSVSPVSNTPATPLSVNTIDQFYSTQLLRYDGLEAEINSILDPIDQRNQLIQAQRAALDGLNDAAAALIADNQYVVIADSKAVDSAKQQIATIDALLGKLNATLQYRNTLAFSDGVDVYWTRYAAGDISWELGGIFTASGYAKYQDELKFFADMGAQGVDLSIRAIYSGLQMPDSTPAQVTLCSKTDIRAWIADLTAKRAFLQGQVSAAQFTVDLQVLRDAGLDMSLSGPTTINGINAPTGFVQILKSDIRTWISQLTTTISAMDKSFTPEETARIEALEGKKQELIAMLMNILGKNFDCKQTIMQHF